MQQSFVGSRSYSPTNRSACVLCATRPPITKPRADFASNGDHGTSSVSYKLVEQFRENECTNPWHRRKRQIATSVTHWRCMVFRTHRHNCRRLSVSGCYITLLLINLKVTTPMCVSEISVTFICRLEIIQKLHKHYVCKHT